MFKFPRAAIIGVGLIGGSCALAWRNSGCVGTIVGIGRSRSNLEEALSLGVIDEIATDLPSGVAGADVVLVATPVGQFGRIFEEILPVLAPGGLITDGGSTKRDVVAVARRVLGPRFPSFVPAHPIAGAEKSGVTAARVDLFQGRHVVLTPTAETDPAAMDGASVLWRACGARLSVLSPEAHDAIFAAVSHLPHVLAYALVDMISSRSNADELLRYAAGGFRDFTRIASSSPEMWRDIGMANRDLLLAEIDSYTEALGVLRAAIERGDGDALVKVFDNARNRRDNWLRSQEVAK